ncbi:tyrosine-type recombinase/integrase [Variovorax sp. RHLX14]|uniref:tyrosine-type recombinase/integrase n=1 Tax=Variovorax sp. RHLX14 TaxID=1259731 RepID=UPI003F4725D1
MSKVTLTVARIQALKCPTDKAQVFLWDLNAPNLGVRLKPNGTPSFIFQGSLLGKSIRLTIGRCATLTIPEAKAEAVRLQKMINDGLDPRLEMEKILAATVAAQDEKRKVGVTVGQVWMDYMDRGTAKKGRDWSLSYNDKRANAMSPGGKLPKRGTKKTVPGILFSLNGVLLKDLDDNRVHAWAVAELAAIAARSTKKKTARKPGYASVKAGSEWLSGMLRWCSTQVDYKSIVDARAVRSSTVQDNIPSGTGARRKDLLEVGQLEDFFASMDLMKNRAFAGYLTVILLSGARREEVSAVKWSDIDFRWKKFTIHNKTTEDVERVRVLPMTPYIESVFKAMPKINEYVFASKRSKRGYVQDSRKSLARVLAAAKLPHLTIHGFRRTYSLLYEEAGCVASAMEQIIGHVVKTMDEHYKPRTVEQLRPWLERYENFVIEKARLQSLYVEKPKVEKVKKTVRQKATA